MIDVLFLVGWSTGAFSMIVFNELYESYGRYMKALRESRCDCQKTLDDFRGEEE